MTLDLKMPGLDGFEVLKSLRQKDSRDHVRVLVVSGLSEPDLQRARDAGADDVLRKPFRPSELIRRVRELTQFSDARPA